MLYLDSIIGYRVTIPLFDYISALSPPHQPMTLVAALVLGGDFVVVGSFVPNDKLDSSRCNICLTIVLKQLILLYFLSSKFGDSTYRSSFIIG